MTQVINNSYNNMGVKNCNCGNNYQNHLLPNPALQNHNQATPTKEERADTLTISPAAQKAFEKEEDSKNPAPETEPSSKKNDSSLANNYNKLSEAQLSNLRKLQARDAEVKIHEQQHMAVAGSYALGGPSYQYTVGPDGRQYAVGGQVKLDVSPIPNDPEATISKAQTIRRAALAPANPSGADRSVAANASKMEAEAQAELTKKTATEDPPDKTDQEPSSHVKEDFDEKQVHQF